MDTDIDTTLSQVSHICCLIVVAPSLQKFTHNGSVNHPILVVLSKCVFLGFLVCASCGPIVTN